MNEFIVRLVRDGVPWATVTQTGGSITMDAAAAVKRALRCTLHDLPPGADLLLDRLQVCDSNLIPVGLFMVTTAPKTVSADGVVTRDVEAYDLTYLLQRTRVESINDCYWPAGTLYTAIADQILVRCGITDALVVPSEAALSSDRGDWDIGTSWLDVLNALLAEISYQSVWVDSAGVVRIEPYIEPDRRQLMHDYRQGRDSIILRRHTVEDDTFGAANVWTVLVDTPDLTEPIVVQSVNDDPDSKLSTVHRGRIMAPVVRLDGITDQAAAQKYCDGLRRKGMATAETALIQTAPETGHEALDMLSIDLPELTGLWEETAWTLPLSGGRMQHTIRRIRYV